MALTLDPLDFTSTATEENGVVVGLKSRQLVKGITARGANLMAEVYGSATPPQPNAAPAAFPHLRLVRRHIEAIPGSPDKCYLVCEWSRLGGGEDMNFRFTGGTSLSQITTQKDRVGNAISVQHTWAAGDKDWPGITETQGADVSVYLPQSTLRASGKMQSVNPLLITQQWAGSVNMYLWLGAPAGSWLCTAVNFRPHDYTTTPYTWAVEFEFQNNLQGWQPVAWFKDPRTGGPAPGLVANVGIKTVDWYPQLSFAEVAPYFTSW